MAGRRVFSGPVLLGALSAFLLPAGCGPEVLTEPPSDLPSSEPPTGGPLPHPLTDIVVGREYACGLELDGVAFCWGMIPAPTEDPQARR
jgi:hypothetical protein